MTLRIPVVGALSWHHEAAAVCETLATMLEGGGDLISGLEQAQEVLSSPEIAARLERTRTDVRTGVDLGAALSEHRVLPPLVLATIRAGISGGDLPGAARRATRACLERQDRVTQRLMTLLEPAVIGVLAIAVLWIVYALVSGMLAMNDLQGL
ncbi:MAG: type II secretion system F family protein [Chloroflexi bacterium]|nr:type II secretion system F family protein [Chloroflexota bacterium]